MDTLTKILVAKDVRELKNSAAKMLEYIQKERAKDNTPDLFHVEGALANAVTELTEADDYLTGKEKV